MGKSRNDEPAFSFAKLPDMDNYTNWAREMRYSLESARLWDHMLSDQENPNPVAIILKGENLEDDAKLECREKCKIHTWTKNNIKCKDHIGRMCLTHIQQEFQAVKTDWLAHDLWEWLKKRYTF